jgi:hypothetical protein
MSLINFSEAIRDKKSASDWIVKEHVISLARISRTYPPWAGLSRMPSLHGPGRGAPGSRIEFEYTVRQSIGKPAAANSAARASGRKRTAAKSSLSQKPIAIIRGDSAGQKPNRFL